MDYILPQRRFGFAFQQPANLAARIVPRDSECAPERRELLVFYIKRAQSRLCGMRKLVGYLSQPLDEIVRQLRNSRAPESRLAYLKRQTLESMIRQTLRDVQNAGAKFEHAPRASEVS